MTHSMGRATFGFAAIVSFLGGCAVCSGCGGGSPHSDTVTSRRSESSGSAASSGGVASEATATTDSTGGLEQEPRSMTTGAAGTSAPSRVSGVDSPSANGGTAPQPMISRDEEIARWSSQLAAAEQQLQAAPGVCRDVCRATSSICVASRELCALTGDRVGAPPTDPRCARARASCDRATRQRDESCQTCPSE
ncbi:MAG: hypothetical protein JNK05_18660 [Myxococcales bacterium]|nr:hypothetical protein [Myxococcales bacterium]